MSLGMDGDPSVLRETDRHSGHFLGSPCEWHQLIASRVRAGSHGGFVNFRRFRMKRETPLMPPASPGT